jgi:hypothetical protein
MTYPNLDWLVPLYVDGYISLTQAQSRSLQTHLKRALGWHCQTQLPAYARVLRNLAMDVADPRLSLGVERLRSYADQLKIRWQDVKIHIGPEMADILATASDEQLAELSENIQQRNDAFKEEFVDIPLDQLERMRRKKMIARIQRWLSGITPAQMQAVADWSAAIRPLAADGLDYRRHVAAELLNLLSTRKAEPDFKDALVDLVVNVDQRRPTHYQNKIDVNTDLTLRLLVQLERSLTPTQRSRLLKRIHVLVSDLEKLSCQPAAAHRWIPEPVEAM